MQKCFSRQNDLQKLKILKIFNLEKVFYVEHEKSSGQGSKFAMRIRTIAKNCEAKRIRFASLRTKLTRLRFAFASQFLKRVRFRFAFAIGTDCEFAEQNLRKSHCFQNIFQGFYGVNSNEVLF